MKTAFYIAKRYLISKKSVNVINIISGVSIAGVSIGTLALVVVLSVFNGFDSVIKSMFSSFDPDLKITIEKGKTFNPNQDKLNAVKQLPEIASFTEIIEDETLIRYNKKQFFATVKGIPSDYFKIAGLDSTIIVEGQFQMTDHQTPLAIVGQGVAYSLSVGLNFFEPLHLYALKKKKGIRPTISNSFTHETIFPSGVFMVQQEIDSKYVLVPFDFAKELFDMKDRVSFIEINLKEGSSDTGVKEKITALLGDEFVVKTQYEQHELLYKIMRSEKWAIFLILSFILIIASFNILGSLSMLIIDKKADISILQSMGAGKKLIRRIFLFEGWLISILGAISGLIIGILTCWIQIHFELLKLPGNGSFIISAYPVEIQFLDLISVFLVVIAIGFLAAWYPVRFISGKYLDN